MWSDIFELIMELLNCNSSILVVAGGEVSHTLKFKLFLVLCWLITNSLILFKFPCIWLLLLPTTRVLIINPFLWVTQPDCRFTRSGRWLLYYAHQHHSKCCILFFYSVSWGCRIHQRHLSRRVRPLLQTI